MQTAITMSSISKTKVDATFLFLVETNETSASNEAAKRGREDGKNDNLLFF